VSDTIQAIGGIIQVRRLPDRSLHNGGPLFCHQWEVCLMVQTKGETRWCCVRANPKDDGWEPWRLRDEARQHAWYCEAILAEGGTIYCAVDNKAVPIRAADFGVKFRIRKQVGLFERTACEAAAEQAAD
jgi:hypothetical protein